MPKNFYITTTLPYVNAKPHIGFALEIVAADVIARFKRNQGDSVIFNTGTDEHGQKIYEQALKTKQNPQDYVDEYAAKFDALKDLLNLSYSNFIRTTNKHHVAAAQEFWKACDANGYIYKKNYQTKYCVGCELEKTESELENGRCPLHPNKDLELREEENYFFKFSEFQQPLLDFYKAHPDFVKPEGKYKEIISFVESGLQDFSISRLSEKMPWGIPVPGDKEHVMYVWFDALVNYISTLGWPCSAGSSQGEACDYEKFWPGVQLCGKDNLRQQTAMWQAMLMAAKLPNSRQVLVNGFISVEGQKMSKSLGNVISPEEMVERYGVDATRYLLMNLGPFGTDMDVSWEKFDITYKADLQDGLGNLCSRVAKLCEKADLNGQKPPVNLVNKNLAKFNLKEALEEIIKVISEQDKYLAENKPWQKSGKEQEEILLHAVEKILQIASSLLPFMPATSQKIFDHFSKDKIKALEPLFPRLS